MIAVKYNFLFFKYNTMNLLNLEEYELDPAFRKNLEILTKNIRQEEKV